MTDNSDGINETANNGELAWIPLDNIVIRSGDPPPFISGKKKKDIDKSEKNEELLLGINVEKNLYCIDSMLVKEVRRTRKITKAPFCAPSVLGLVNLRGDLIPVISFRLLLGLPRIALTKETRIVVLNLERGEVGLLADSVTELVKFRRTYSLETSKDITVDPDIVTAYGKANYRLSAWLDIKKAVEKGTLM